jgi:hypothetical protein
MLLRNFLFRFLTVDRKATRAVRRADRFLFQVPQRAAQKGARQLRDVEPSEDLSFVPSEQELPRALLRPGKLVWLRAEMQPAKGSTCR